MATMKMGATYGSPSYPTGNKYRSGHDDGSIPKNMPRRKAGGMDMKHSSPAHSTYGSSHNPGSHNPY